MKNTERNTGCQAHQGRSTGFMRKCLKQIYLRWRRAWRSSATTQQTQQACDGPTPVNRLAWLPAEAGTLATRVLALVTFVMLMIPSLHAQEPYSTSFEKCAVGKFKKLSSDGATWSTDGQSEITEKFAKTGKKCLHIFGGEGNTLELMLDGEKRNAKGISFWAERWTSKAPFKFRIKAQVNGSWEEIANLDKLVQVGARFRSQIVLNMPHDPVNRLRLVLTAPAKAGILIDDFALLKNKPKKITKAPKVTGMPIKKLLENKALFVSGTENTHTFRIPAIITAPNGDLIACCDARRKSSADLIWVRDIDIVVKRSSDNGRTWSNMELVCDYGDGKPASDPSFILDKETGEIFCFYNYMDQDNAPKEFRLYVQSSNDNGKTWGKARDITDQIALPSWKMDFKFITSGRGVQRRNGDLLHTMVNLKHGLHLFGSKDHGKSWHMINVPVKPANESKVIELADGRLMINSRVNKGANCRWVHTSENNGKTWDSKPDHTLIDPGCNGSILRYTSVKDGYAKNRLLFCNANSPNGRKNLTVRISYDEGETWSKGKVIDKGPAAYSSLTICKDGTIGVLYEPGYKEVRFARFTLEDLTDGKDKLSKPYIIGGTQDMLAQDQFAAVVGDRQLSEQLSVFKVTKDARYTVDGKPRWVGAGFQPSVLSDHKGRIHVFFQARLDGSGDKSEKMIAHVVSENCGRTFSGITFVTQLPMQIYAVSSFTRKLPSGKERISILTSLSIDETVARLKDPALIKKRLDIDVSSFSRKAACLILEFYSDDGGKSWKRKEHREVSDRVYKRNGRDYYLAFINLIGQVRKIEAGPHKGRLILGGPLRGDYLPCPDYPRFRQYKPSSSLIYSDDAGETWNFGGVISDKTAFAHNEASAAPVNDGKQILLVRRSNTKGSKGKIMHYSDDGGATWGPGFLTTVTSTRCLQILETSGDTVLCSAPGKTNRTNGRIYISRDGGRTWSHKLIEKGLFSYSTVNRLTNDYFMCCYSLGHHGEKGLGARIFSAKWIDTE